jgi:hypothetical protein
MFNGDWTYGGDFSRIAGDRGCEGKKLRKKTEKKVKQKGPSF